MKNYNSASLCSDKPKYLIDESGNYILDESGNKTIISYTSCPKKIIPMNFNTNNNEKQISNARRQAARLRNNRQLR